MAYTIVLFCQKQIFKDCEEGIHDWDSGTVTKKATCTANGIKTYTCTKCKATKTETIKATGHSYDNGKITKSLQVHQQVLKPTPAQSARQRKRKRLQR